MKIIARIKTDFDTKFGIPRQSGMAENESAIIFEKEYRNPEALRGLEGFSHIWLIWNFSESEIEKWQPTVRPPRLGGNKRMGVFATRSPFRPNPIGLSCVKISSIEKTDEYGYIIKVLGADLMNGTPIYDIKPYLPMTDCIKEATGGFASEFENYSLSVVFPDDLIGKMPEEKRESLIKVLSLDPRPSYQDDPDREYGMTFADYNVKFKVDKKSLTVISLDKVRNS